MFVTTAKERMKRYQSEEEYLLNMYHDTTKFYLDNKDVELTEVQYLNANNTMSDMIDMQLSLAHTKAILQLYPHAKIRYAIDGGPEDLSFALSHFFLGCPWPTYADSVDIDNFIELLQRQALLLFPELKK